MDPNKIEVLQVGWKVIKFWGILPKSGNKLRFSERISSILLMANCSILTITSLMHVIYNTKRRTITREEFIEDISVIFSTVGTILVVCYITLNVPKIVAFIDSLNDFSDFSLPPAVLEVNKYANVLTASWISAGLTGTFLYFIYKIGFDKACYKNNEIFKRTDTCGTFVPTRLPFTIAKEHMWMLHLIQLNAYVPCICAACTIVIQMVGCGEMIIVRIKHLKQLLSDAVHAEDKDLRQDRIRNCVMYHIHIIKLADQFNHSYTWYFFIYFMQNGPLISMNGFNLLISTSISETIYATNWYEIDISSQKTLKLMMLRSQKQLEVTGWLWTSSLTTLTSILKTSYSIITLLNTVYA